MPITKAAKKALRQSKVRQERNVKMKNRIKSITRLVNDLVKEGKKKEAEEALRKAYSALDKAAKKKLIKKNTVGRRKARLARSVIGGDKKKTPTKKVTKKATKKAAKKTKK